MEALGPKSMRRRMSIRGFSIMRYVTAIPIL